MDRWAAAQHDTRPIEGVCASACTVRLSRARCIAPDAVLGFHRATDALATRQLLWSYKTRLRAYVIAHCLDGSVCWVSGARMAQFGYRLC